MINLLIRSGALNPEGMKREKNASAFFDSAPSGAAVWITFEFCPD
jgi:hypothetical protein